MVEGTLIPVAVFWITIRLLGPWVALGVGLAWVYATIVRRLLMRRPVPGVFVIAAITATVRTALAVSTHSLVLYFLQPSLGAVMVSLAFLASVIAGKPLAARLAHDFCPLPEGWVDKDWVRAFFLRISLLWAMVLLVNAGLTVWLALSQSVQVVAVARPLAAGALTVSRDRARPRGTSSARCAARAAGRRCDRLRLARRPIAPVVRDSDVLVRPTLVTADAVSLLARCWLSTGTPRAAVVIAHGFAAHAEDPEVARNGRGVASDAISTSSRTTPAVTADPRVRPRSAISSATTSPAAVELAQRRTDRVVLVGASMGAIAVLRCASERTALAGVVTVSCPARWRLPRTARAVAAALLTRTPPGRMVAARAMHVRIAPVWTNPAPPVELVTRITTPIAVLHGAADRFIPVSDALDLHDHAPTPRTLHVVDGMDHAFSPPALDPVADAVDWALDASPAV